MYRHYPFVSEHYTGYIRGCRKVLGKAVKDLRVRKLQGNVDEPPALWEPRIDNGYPNVFYDTLHDEYRCYYTSLLRDDATTCHTPQEQLNHEYDLSNPAYRPRVAGILLMTSKDGLHWQRPDLGVCTWEGSIHHNILLVDAHGASVFLDAHETEPQRRYKMVVRHDAHEKMAVAFSSDGIHFTEPIDWLGVSPAGDTHNFAYWDADLERYVLYTRIWSMGRLRLAARCESTDFIHWSKPVEVFRGNSFAEQWYSMPVFQRDGVHFALASIYHDGDRASVDFDCTDCELLYSEDGWHWERAMAGTPLIPRSEGKFGENVPDCCCVYASAPVEKDGVYRIYYFGGDGQHTSFRHSTLLCAQIGADKLAGYAPYEAIGWVGTCPLQLDGDALWIDADIRPGGTIRAALALPVSLHGQLEPLDGYGFGDSRVQLQPDGRYKVDFPGCTMAQLASQRLVVVFALENAVIYGYGGEITAL